MRAGVLAVCLLVCSSAAGAAVEQPPQVAYLHRGKAVVLDVATGSKRVVLGGGGMGLVAWSGDGKLVSVGGRIAGGPALPTIWLAWAPSGETAAYVTKGGSVRIWTPHGRRVVVPDGWGALTWPRGMGLAWSPDGRLAIGRTLCHAPCGETAGELWVWNSRSGRLQRILRVPYARGLPVPAGWDAHGRALWFAWPNSSSIAADGVSLYANRTRLAEMLMYPDWVARCGSGLALAAGGDRNSMAGKRILLKARDVSRDRSRSWISPSCSSDGSALVASAGRTNTQGPWGNEHRAIWQLLPVRRQLTRPLAGWSDEDPQVLSDGSILFVRTREQPFRRNGEPFATMLGRLELLRGETLTQLADVSLPPGQSTMYYGHYDWSSVAVRP